MKRIDRRADLHARIVEARAAGARIGFVPTMGYLHDGHLALVDRAREHADFVVMSIFVNPLQFGPKEDLASYPRDLERDAGLAQRRGVDLLFHPSTREVYPHGTPALGFCAPELIDRLCGHFRPGHFEGVLAVVAKLFHLVQPDVAVFGRKDFQQTVLIRRMVEDFDFPVEIVVAPLIREPDGLAMSSRNVRLDAQQRSAATSLHRALRTALRAFENGESNAVGLLDLVQRVIAEQPIMQLQYAELVDPHTLAAQPNARSGDVIALAAFAGTTRLIDNEVLP